MRSELGKGSGGVSMSLIHGRGLLRSGVSIFGMRVQWSGFMMWSMRLGDLYSEMLTFGPFVFVHWRKERAA